MREIHARKSSIDSSCFPVNCSRWRHAFSTASWLTSCASAVFQSARAHGGTASAGRGTHFGNASGFPFRASVSRLRRGRALAIESERCCAHVGASSGSPSAPFFQSYVDENTRDTLADADKLRAATDDFGTACRESGQMPSGDSPRLPRTVAADAISIRFAKLSRDHLCFPYTQTRFDAIEEVRERALVLWVPGATLDRKSMGPTASVSGCVSQGAVPGGCASPPARRNSVHAENRKLRLSQRHTSLRRQHL